MERHFMRFYGRTDDEIRQFIEEIKSLGFKPVRVTIADAEVTCNMFVPQKYQPVMEVRFYFPTLEDARALHDNEDVKVIYDKWAIKNRPEGGKIVMREPKDIAFGIT